MEITVQYMIRVYAPHESHNEAIVDDFIVGCSVCPSSSSLAPFFWGTSVYNQPSQPMPLGSKKLRIAKQKRHHRHATFAKCATSPSSNQSNYCALESDTKAVSMTEADSTDESEADDQTVTPVETLEGWQCLFSVFLPPHLQLKEKSRQKHQKISNRQPVYTGDLRMTAWWKNTMQRKAAKGCTMLDAFVLKKVHFVSVLVNIKYLIQI